jgi:hypothetical protein
MALRLHRTYPLIILALVLCRMVSSGPYRNGPEIRSDGVGYHAWTRAILTRDLSFCAFRDQGAGMISFEDPGRGICQNKYPAGLALLRLPVMAFLVDRSPGAPLISPAEHRASAILSALSLWITAALSIWTLAMLRVQAGRANAIVALVVLGTGLFHYGTYDGSFTHVYSAMFCGLLCAFAVREQMLERPVPIIAAFLCTFFLIAIRTTNVFLLAAMCAAYLIWKRRVLSRQVWMRCLIALAGAGLAVAIQVAYNYYVHRTFMINSYGSEAFLFERPMQSEVLLSYERGLLTYQPIYALAVLCGLLVPGARAWGGLLLATVAAYVVLYGYWHSWMLGGGMGHRGFVELAPIVAIALGLAASSLSLSQFTTVAMMGAACTLITLSVMIGYWAGTYPFGGATSGIYWKHVIGFELEESVPNSARPSARISTVCGLSAPSTELRNRSASARRIKSE